MKYNIIDGLSDASIESKVELVTYLIKRARKRKSNEEFGELILNYLLEREKIPNLGSYCLIGSKYALGCLIGNFLYHYISVKVFSEQVNLLIGLLNYIKGFQPSSNPLLKKTTTRKLIDGLEKFGLPSYFLKTSYIRPLRVYYIPYRHVDANAGYFPYINSIVSYRPGEDGLNPEYIFVHEVGHLLTFNLTGDANRVPDSFIEFNKRFNPAWKGDLVEVFVDLFSMAAMMGTEYAARNPFLTTFSIKQQEIIRDYFITLLDNIKYSNHNSNDLF